MLLRHILISLLLLLCPLWALAQDGERKSQPAVVKGAYWVKGLIDTMAVSGIDQDYLEVPKRPWQVELRSTANESSLKMDGVWDNGQGQKMTISSMSSSGFFTSLGVWAGYRGYGFGYSKELKGGEGSTFSLGAVGGRFGINLRYSTFRSKTPDLTITNEDGGVITTEDETIDLDAPIKVKSLFIDGYYLFNGKHFSYAAAYDQSIIQRRSAGSFMAGLMYYRTNVDYSDNSNWGLSYLMCGVGKIRVTQMSVGFGYSYNWVPAKGWLVNVMAMPMLTFYNKLKFYYYPDIYNVKIDDIVTEEDYYSILLGDVHEKALPNRVIVNFDGRMSVVYNWERIYLRAVGLFNHFRYGDDRNNGWLADWTAYLSLGFRL